MHEATPRFWRCYQTLPIEIQETARKNYRLLRHNPRHPSLHFKKVGPFWSARVGKNYRALAVEDADRFVWVWIGSHEEYNQLINA